MTSKRRSTAKIDPVQWFSAWHYVIGPHHWATLGVERREFVDKEPTAKARAAASAAGLPKSQLSRIKITRKDWVPTGTTDFQEFDVFWSCTSSHALQIVHIGDLVEVHWVTPGEKRRAYMMSEAQLAACLQDGKILEETRIYNAESKSDVLRFSIENPEGC